jgi:hypothetical protein
MMWEMLSRDCHLLIDRPEEASGGKPPYFISRIETLLRRSDVYVACLPALPSDRHETRRRGAQGDWRYTRCSPYILFELRLAERADLPRFVLYDLASRFRPPDYQPPYVRYVGRQFGELREVISGGGEDAALAEDLTQWLSWVQRNHRPRRTLESRRTALLLSDAAESAAFREVIVEAVDESGFDRPQPLLELFQTDAEFYQSLRSLGLLVVDVSVPQLLPLYHAAHALLVPTIRLHTATVAGGASADEFLPALLRGHPAGYQCDLVMGTADDQTFNAVQERSLAITRCAQPVFGFESGRSMLFERTYPKHSVFISHDEKLNDRALVDEIVRECGLQGITCWEYAVENRSGDAWRENMNAALARATHMVSLMSNGYEQSPGCVEEWTHALDNRDRIALRPFLTHGRTRPAVGLRGQEITHEPLQESSGISENAMKVVKRIKEALLANSS